MINEIMRFLTSEDWQWWQWSTDSQLLLFYEIFLSYAPVVISCPFVTGTFLSNLKRIS